jgi:ABC-type sugar transport system ATPase subunit
MTAPDSQALLTLDSIAQRYGEVPVLQGVSFAIRRGTIACLLGA